MGERKRRTNPDFMNGIPELLILQLLTENEMYGYQIVQAIRDRSGGGLDFGEGCIYPILHRLEKQGDLKSRREKVGGRSRVVYKASRQGGKRLSDSADRWHAVVNAVGEVLQGGSHEQPAVV